jgi:tRNA dimethylallyltransferase
MGAPEPIFLAGATATGKSDLAFLLAEHLHGEIISVDSMQVYRGLNIGTAKASPQERTRIPHHLLDVVDLTEKFDAARFVRLAHQAAEDITNRGRVPIFCGGTGLYFQAYFQGLGEAPPADSRIRLELQNSPLPLLLEELARRDPITFNKIDRSNPRRVVRALEVIRMTGKAFSEQRAEWKKELTPRFFFGIARSPEDLRKRIDSRVEAMFQRGLVAETTELLAKGLEQNETAMQAIGYRQVVEHLRGERDLAATIELVKIRTRQFAKRQMTWFRRQPGLNWISWAEGEKVEAKLDEVMRALKS